MSDHVFYSGYVYSNRWFKCALCGFEYGAFYRVWMETSEGGSDELAAQRWDWESEKKLEGALPIVKCPGCQEYDEAVAERVKMSWFKKLLKRYPKCVDTRILTPGEFERFYEAYGEREQMKMMGAIVDGLPVPRLDR